MLNRITIVLCMIFVIPSCQTDAIARPTPTQLHPTKTEETSLATETPGREPEPIQSDVPDLPNCFVYTEVSPIAFLPDSIRLLIKERSGVRIINLDTLEESILQAPQDVVSVALSPDGEMLAWALSDNTIQLIEIDDQGLVGTLEGHTLPVLKLRFSPTGDRLYSASYDTWVRIWDLEGNQVDAFQPTGADDLPKEIEGMGVSPDGARLGSIPFDGPAKIWDLSTKEEVADLGGTGGDVTSDIAFSPDGRYVAADQAGHLSLWQTSDWNVVWTGATSLAFAFSPDGTLLAYFDMDDNVVILRSLDDLQKSRILNENQSPIYELFFSPDGTFLASAGAGIQIWQTESGHLSYVGKATCP